MKLINKNNLLIILIIALALIFRFVNFTKLQYFSDDENIFFIILRKMLIEKKPVLISPNEVLVFNLGSFFHLLSFIPYVLVKGSPVYMGIFSSLLGGLTTFLVFKAGSLMNKKVGELSAFIYACSFLIALFDRRYWPLTPNPLLNTLALISLYKIITQVNYSWFYSLLFIFSSIFAWHSDFSLLVIPLAGFLGWLKYRPKILKKNNLPALFLLIFSFLPLIIFELRHNLVTLKIMSSLLMRFQATKPSLVNINFRLIPETIMRMIFVSSENLENNFAYESKLYPFPQYSSFSALIIVLCFGAFLRVFLKRKKENKSFLELILVFFFTFLLGFLIHAGLYGGIFCQHYLSVLFPIICLILGVGLEFWLKRKPGVLVYLFLGVFLIMNLKTLFSSRIAYSPYEKLKAVEKIKGGLKDKKFAAYDFGFAGAGWHYFYLYHDLHPVKGTDLDNWYWVYMTHSLFDITPQTEWPEIVVVMKGEQGKIRPIVLDNSQQWITKEKLEVLTGSK